MIRGNRRLSEFDWETADGALAFSRAFLKAWKGTCCISGMTLPWLVPSVRLAVLLLALSQVETRGDQWVYRDSLENDWENWSWAKTGNSATTFHSGAQALFVQSGAWQAGYFHHAALDSSAFASLEFWIHGGPVGGQKLQVQGLQQGVARAGTNLPALPADQWTSFTIPLANLGVAGVGDWDGFWIQDRTGAALPTFFLDDIRLVARGQSPEITNGVVQIRVDPTLSRHPISPLIYGLAFATGAELSDLNVTMNRSGGNAESRYDWQLNAHNRGADWFFESLADEPAIPGAAADAFIAASLSGGAQPMITVPMLGWAPKLGANRKRLASYSIAKYGPQTQADSQWFPDAGNGIRATDGKFLTSNDPNDANRPVDVEYQRGWMEHLRGKWSTGANGGVHWFCMDNEPSLWHSSHRDVHAMGATMREVRDRFFAYAEMVKQIDESALIAGPEEWGWSGYLYSGYDQQAGAANGWTRFPDRSTNGEWDYLPWFLDQLQQRQRETGRRLLDLFTVHYYPQGGEYSGSTSTAMQLRRNRSTRSLWDTNYVDESWINNRVMLIPRLRRWVESYYPGTRLGLTEYNWGAEEHINGATSQADVLGILGREGLDVATRWTTPRSGTPTYNAFKMFRNYDGHTSAFGETSIQAGGSNPDELSVFAAERASDRAITVMLVHKRLDGATPVILELTNALTSPTVQAWRLTSANTIRQLPDLAMNGTSVALTLPAQSLTLLVLNQATLGFVWKLSREANQIQISVEGPPNRSYFIEQSPDLVTWAPLSPSKAYPFKSRFSLAATNTAWFMRAVIAP